MTVEMDGIKLELQFEKDGVCVVFSGDDKKVVVPWQAIFLLLMVGLFSGRTQSKLIDITTEESGNVSVQ